MGKRLLLISMILFHLGGIALFCLGFFPIKSIPSQGDQLQAWKSKSDQIIGSISEGAVKHCIQSFTSVPGQSSKVNVTKFVVLIIDALREDFLLSRAFQNHTPFVSTLLRTGKAIGIKARTQAPTVTLPRVKAMIAGSVPAFIDATMNLDSPTLSEDSLVKRLRESGKNIVFYGDDVWLKLFPGQFLRSEGTSSFFVSDYTEVDDNVTRHLDKELENTDWDVMILHYSGVDHIGHSFGPRSNLLPIKMQEMDGIVKKIYQGLIAQTKQFTISIMGDHGMSEVGSHGGATEMETTIPLFFASPMITVSKAPAIKGFEVQQIDFVPTFSAIMGLPVPEQNLGIPVAQVLSSFSFSSIDILSALAYNFMQIQGLWKQDHSFTEKDNSFDMVYRIFDHLKGECTGRRQQNETRQLLEEAYLSLQGLRNELIISFTNYSLPKMISGAALTTCVTIFSFILFTKRTKALERNRLDLWNHSLVKKFLLIGTVLHALSLGSSSFIEEEHQTWYFIWASLLMCLLYAAFTMRNKKQQYSSGTNRQIFSILLLMVLHRVGRGWNQTGVKFAHLPDFRDWLSEPKNSPIVYSSVLVVCAAIFIMHGRIGFTKIIFLVGIILGLIHQFSMEASQNESKYLQAARENQIVLARLATIGVIILGFSDLFCAIICFGVLNLKLVNIPLVLLIVICFRCMDSLMLSPGNWCSRTLAAYWFSFTTYFYLGSSNSLGTIDISCGYFLVESHQAPIVAVPVTLAVYFGPILTWNLFIQSLPLLNRKESFEFGATVLFLRSLPLAIYGFVVFLERNHLFVWSVFAPKLLYEVSHSILYCAIVVFIVFLRS